MRLKNKLIIILSTVLTLLIALEITIGESYFEKYFRYMKAKELEKINFISNKKINFKELQLYQKKQNAFVVLLKNGIILNTENFDYMEIETKKGIKKILLNAFLDNLYSKHKFRFDKDDTVHIDALEVFKDYYIPIEIIKNNKRFRDYKFKNTKLKKYSFIGKILKIENSHLNLSQGDDLLEALLEVNAFKRQNKHYFEKDGDDEFQLISKNIQGYKVIVFYSYENINDIFPTLKVYFYFKGAIFILLTLMLGMILEKIIIKPIEKISNVANDIGQLKFSTKIYSKSNDEIGNLYNNISKMSENLENIINLYKEELKSNKNLQINLEESIKYFMHEVKTPLSVIIGFSDLLLLQKNNSEELQIVNAEGKRLLRLTNELLLNNIIKEDEIILNKKIFDIVSLIELANKICETEKINLKILLKKEKFSSVYGDPEKIEQVLLNFIKNAIEHAKDTVSISLKEEKNNIYIFIENNGPQIPEENFKFLWDKFYSTNIKGRGLGLFISSKILKAHNSTYGAENTKDGVLFYFSIKISN